MISGKIEIGNLKYILPPEIKNEIEKIDELVRVYEEYKKAEIAVEENIYKKYPEYRWIGAFVLGNLLYSSNHFEEAEKYYRDAIEVFPISYEAHFNLGNLLDDLNRNKEAEKEYREAINLNPRDVAPYHRLANLLKKTGRYEEAKQIYTYIITTIKKNGNYFLEVFPEWVYGKDLKDTLYLERLGEIKKIIGSDFYNEKDAFNIQKFTENVLPNLLSQLYNEKDAFNIQKFTENVLPNLLSQLTDIKDIKKKDYKKLLRLIDDTLTIALADFADVKGEKAILKYNEWANKLPFPFGIFGCSYVKSKTGGRIPLDPTKEKKSMIRAIEENIKEITSPFSRKY